MKKFLNLFLTTILISGFFSCAGFDTETKIVIRLPSANRSTDNDNFYDADDAVKYTATFTDENDESITVTNKGNIIESPELEEGTYSIIVLAFNPEGIEIADNREEPAEVALAAGEQKNVSIRIRAHKKTWQEQVPGSFIKVSSYDDLCNITDGNKYILTQDITVSSGDGWVRKFEGSDFGGTLDGNDHTIEFTYESSQPLFHGLTSTGVIKNLKIKGDFKNTEIDAAQFSPFALNNNSCGLIMGCTFEGTVSNEVGSQCFAFGGDYWGSEKGNFVGCIATITNGTMPTAICARPGENQSVVRGVSYSNDTTKSADDLNNEISQWNNEHEDDDSMKCYWKFSMLNNVTLTMIHVTTPL